MDGPRPEKVAVVDEVRVRLSNSSASIVTEYRGLSVSELAELRRLLTAAGGDYKIYKNTLVRLAVGGGEFEPLQTMLTGPTAIAFVDGDLSAVAKVMREFSRSNPHLVVKGGFTDGKLLYEGELKILADLPPRDALLARLAGGFAAPLRQFGALMEALPKSLAYGISALLDAKGGPVASDAGQPEQPEQAEQPEQVGGSAEVEAEVEAEGEGS